MQAKAAVEEEVAVAVVAVARGKKFTLTKLRGRCSLSLGVIGELTDLDICSLLLLVCRPSTFSISPFLTLQAVLLCRMHPAEKYFLVFLLQARA